MSSAQPSNRGLAPLYTLVVLSLACAPKAATPVMGLGNGVESVACRSLQPVSAGGEAPPSSSIALRWLGTANYELAYKNQVVLLDAFFDRGPRNRGIGVTPEDMTKVDLILVGHAHWDHIADAARIAQRTRALVVGAASAIQVVKAAGLPAELTRPVSGRGDEVLQFDGFTVEPVLARHSVLQAEVLTKFGEALAKVDSGPTPAEAAAEAAIEARGSSDPTVGSAGTLAYLLTFDTGLRLIWLDSAGPITDEERRLMARIGRVNVAIVAYQGQYLAERQVATTLPLVQLFQPDVYLPAHHDELAGLFLDMGVEPLFTALRKDFRRRGRSARCTYSLYA